MDNYKPAADCHSGLVVQAAIEDILHLWSERVALGGNDKGAGEGEASEADEVSQVDEGEEGNGGKQQNLN